MQFELILGLGNSGPDFVLRTRAGRGKWKSASYEMLADRLILETFDFRINFFSISKRIDLEWKYKYFDSCPKQERSPTEQ